MNADLSTGPNSPTNYAGVSGTVNAAASKVPMLDEWRLVVLLLLLVSGGATYTMWSRVRERQ